jgi:tetratricopeptide (TPR) repeat protein
LRTIGKCGWICAFLGAVGLLRGQSPAAQKQVEIAFKAGATALARGDAKAAEAEFGQVVHLLPRDWQGYSGLGAALLAEGRNRDAIRELETAHALHKGDMPTAANLAVAYQRAGEPAKALPLFAELSANAKRIKQPLAAPVSSSYARALLAMGKTQAAEAEMKAAVEAAPNDAEVHDDLGSIEAQEKSWAEAQREFAAAVALQPQMARARLHLGLALEAQGESGAIEQLSEAARLAPDDPLISLELGKALAAAGKDDQAIPLFQQVLARQPGSTEAMLQLALAEQRAGKLQDAIALLRKVTAEEPENEAALTNLGMALAQVQNAKDAVPFLQRAVKLAPGDVTAHQDLAAAYVQLSQFSDAAAELRLALKLAPDLPQLHYNLGLALKMQDDAADAIPELESAERLDPNAPEAPYVLGILYMQAARYADAARELKKSLDMRPENGDGWATLGSVYVKLNKLPEATAALQQAIKQLPEQPDPHLTLAAVLVKEDKLAEAVAERKAAADLMRRNMNRQRAEVATNAGNSLLKSGDLAGAAIQFKDALSYDAGYAAAHLGLAQVYDAQGNAAGGAEERQKATASQQR